MVIEMRDPENDHTRRVVKMHLDPDGITSDAGIEITVVHLNKNAKDSAWVYDLELNPDVLDKKLKKVEFDITLFQLVERFMRYRVGINAFKMLYSKNSVAIEGALDYIC